MVVPYGTFSSLTVARSRAARDLPAGTAVGWMSEGGIMVGGFVVGNDTAAPPIADRFPAFVLWPDATEDEAGSVAAAQHAAAGSAGLALSTRDRSRSRPGGNHGGRAEAEQALDVLERVGTLTTACYGPKYHVLCAARIQPVALVRWDGFRPVGSTLMVRRRKSVATPFTRTMRAGSSVAGATAWSTASRHDAGTSTSVDAARLCGSGTSLPGYPASRSIPPARTSRLAARSETHRRRARPTFQPDCFRVALAGAASRTRLRLALTVLRATRAARWLSRKCLRRWGLSVVASAGVADEEVPDEFEPDDRRRRRLERAFRRGRRHWRRGGDEGSGGLGVREPRRPKPGGEADGAEVEPEDSGE
jgi:hypothetical protein